MASYYICNTHRFQEQSFSITKQEEMIDADGFTLLEGEPSTEIIPTAEEYFPSFKTFKCNHDVKEKVFGKVFGKNFNYYLKPYDFFVFYNPHSEIALIRLNVDAAEDFVRILNSEKTYKLGKTDIDFSKIIPRVGEVSGLWVSEIKSLNLSSAGYYGNDVHHNPDVQEMIKNGKISHVQIKYSKDINSEEYTIGISLRGSLTLYNKYQTINDEIEVVMDIYQKLLSPS